VSATTDAESLLRSGRSVVFLFQQGGPSQFETFDPKPNALDGVRTVRGVIDTKLPGVQFGDTMSRLARLADRLTVVRSFQTNNGGHNIQPIVGPDSLNANIGSLYSRVAGATRPDSGMPTNTVVFPDAVCKDVLKGRARGDIAATGGLGSVYAPFIPGADGQLQKDMRLSLPKNTLTTRTELAAQLDTLNRALETSPEFKMLNHLQRQAIINDEKWCGGDYDTDDPPARGPASPRRQICPSVAPNSAVETCCGEGDASISRPGK